MFHEQVASAACNSIAQVFSLKITILLRFTEVLLYSSHFITQSSFKYVFKGCGLMKLIICIAPLRVYLSKSGFCIFLEYLAGRNRWWLAHFGATALVWAKAAIIHHCLYTLSANVNTVKKEMTSWNYNKNGFDLADPLKGTAGLPEVHGPHVENWCTMNLLNWASIY